MFAAARIWQLSKLQRMPDHAVEVAQRIFGLDRWLECWTQCTSKDTTDHFNELMFAILHTSEWVDGERDRNRTMANMELASIYYGQKFVDRAPNWPIYVQDVKDPSCLVGIEQHFDIVLTFADGYQVRYIGTIDGLVQKLAAGGALVLDENKTSIRLDEGFLNSFDLKHQLTGYNAASTTVFGFPVLKNRVFAVPVKQNGDPVAIIEPIERTGDMIQNWANWLRHTVKLYEQYENDFENAPMYTHSCNRYFRPCSLLAFCADSPAGRREAFYNEMVPADLSPSERATS